jgi:hypothetical protein
MPQNAYAAFPELTVVELRTLRSSLEESSLVPETFGSPDFDVGYRLCGKPLREACPCDRRHAQSCPHEPEERRTR